MNTRLDAVAPADAAPCCAAFYEQTWVHTLLGESFHPGGEALSRRLLEQFVLQPGARILDVACGTGTTAMLAASIHPGVEVTGIDFSAKNVQKAGARATSSGLEQVDFVHGDAASLPFEGASFDAIICECAVSTFADKSSVAAEFRRVLRPGGQLGISDMCVYEALPDELADFVAPWTCVAQALTVEGYQRLFLDAGFRAWCHEDRSETLLEMALEIKRKLVVLGLGQMAGGLDDLGLDLAQARRRLDQASALAKAGTVQYATMHYSVGPPPERGSADVVTQAASPACVPSTGCC